jgi:flagellar basal-body rod modification protein FlgD
MSVADPISLLASQNTASAAAQARDRLGQKDFLQLMIAQFRNQDPTKPKDPSEFLGQLAQFSTVSGIQDMQTSIATLSESLRSQNVLGGAVLVGREIMAPASEIAASSTQPVSGAIEVPEGVTTVDVTIKDSVGQLVRRVSVPVRDGLNHFAWDGMTDRGEPATAGTYAIEAIAHVGGKDESLRLLLNTYVDSVTIDPKTQGLQLNTRGLGTVSLSDVRRVM